MVRTPLAIAALLLLAINGLVHGWLTDRWSGRREAALEAAGARIKAIPLQLDNWEGRLVESDANNFPEEMVGQHLTVRYVHAASGKSVIVYLACGEPLLMHEQHTPMDCYPANGFKAVLPPTPLTIPSEAADAKPAEFYSATFIKEEKSSSNILRVFWSWQPNSGGWKAHNNPGRSFRASPFLYKIYAIRQLIKPDEPLDNDPCVDLLKELIPSLNAALAPQ